MSTIEDNTIGERIQLERVARKWSLADLAERSTVSKAMISKIERGETSPTAALLGRISAAFQITLSVLLARAEEKGGRLLRADQQPTWRDPETGYVRTQVSPISDVPLELVHVDLPVGASVSYPATSYVFVQHAIWVLSGELTFSEGNSDHQLNAGDCLVLGPPQNCTYRNQGRGACSYLVVIRH
jgi:transcriptional regulator with XRE-family HTH domain